jgi:transcriptional antiterminator RfaH
MSGLNWYVVRTTPLGEYLSAEALERDGFEVFLPRFKAPVPRPSHDDAPLFPGYLFIRCNVEVDGWPFFRTGHRVSGWIRSGNEVPIVPDQIMDVLMRDLDSLADDEGFWRRYIPGEEVNVVSPSVQGAAVVLEESRSPESRVKVVLEFMGRMVHAQVPWDNLRPIDNMPEETATKAPRRTRGKNRRIHAHCPPLADTH